ncbi:MAG: lysophospholipid acyltransferase family protein [Thermodesulfobacteriota bacterium]
MRINTKSLLRSKLFIRVVYRSIRLYSLLFRLRVENEQPWRSHLEKGGRVLLCVWHQQFFSLIRYYRAYKPHGPSLMISQSADGDLIAGVANLTGWHTVRGSSSRGGQTARGQMVDRLRQTGLAAHILDGPRGPFGVVKRGAVEIARDAGAVMVPVFVSAESAWVFHSWDRFFIPKPFSKVRIRYGDMISVAAIADRDGVEKKRRQLESLMQPGLFT